MFTFGTSVVEDLEEEVRPGTSFNEKVHRYPEFTPETCCGHQLKLIEVFRQIQLVGREYTRCSPSHRRRLNLIAEKM